jgi:hypothetical protein
MRGASGEPRTDHASASNRATVRLYLGATDDTFVRAEMSRAEAAAVAAKWQHKSDEVVAFAAPEVPHWPTTSGCRP